MRGVMSHLILTMRTQAGRTTAMLIFSLAQVGCISSSPRQPPLYRDLLACEEEKKLALYNLFPPKQADQDYEKAKIQAREIKDMCVPIADSFIQRQEIYRLNSGELIASFNNLTAAYSDTPDRGGRQLKEVYIRLPEDQKNQARADTVMAFLLRNREFEAARDFAKEHSKFKVTPVPSVSGQERWIEKQPVAQVLKVTSLRSVTIEDFHFPKGDAIIVVFDPYCGYCEKVFRFFKDHRQELSKVYPKIQYLIPQRTLAPGYLQWAVKNPLPQVRLVYREAAFTEQLPVFDTTPYIYFIKDGKIEAVQSGWPENGPELIRQTLMQLEMNR